MSKQFDLDEVRTEAVDVKVMLLKAAEEGAKTMRLPIESLLEWCDKIIFSADEAQKYSATLDEAHQGLIQLKKQLQELL